MYLTASDRVRATKQHTKAGQKRAVHLRFVSFPPPIGQKRCIPAMQTGLMGARDGGVFTTVEGVLRVSAAPCALTGAAPQQRIGACPTCTSP